LSVQAGTLSRLDEGKAEERFGAVEVVVPRMID
jgi:hypothetical protein